MKQLSLIIVLGILSQLCICGDKPVIGIFSLPSGFYLTHDMGHFSYVAVEYVELLQKTGARIVAIDYKLPMDEIKQIMNKVNGLLMPGGGFTMWEKKGKLKIPNHYSKKAFEVIKYAKQINERGDHFPVFGICLGFETIIHAIKGNFDLLSNFKHANVNDKMHSIDRTSRMYRNIPNVLLNWVSRHKVLRYNHDHGFEPKRFVKDQLINKIFKITSKGYDKHYKEFVNSYEARVLPFQGVQFHPEKNVYSFKNKNTDHSPLTKQFDQKLLTGFINNCKRNNHKFKDEEEFQKFNIEKRKLSQTKSTYMGVYFLLDALEVKTTPKLL